MQSRPSRPTGITIIGILVILGGVIGLLVSLAIFAFSAFVSIAGASAIGNIGLIIGGVFLLFSLLWLAVGIGFLNGKGWAWTLGMIVTILSLVGSIGSLAIGLLDGVGGLLFYGLILYYLTRSRVKAFFGKAAWPITPAYPTPLPYGQPPMTSNYQGLNQPHPPSTIPSYTQPPPNNPTLTFNPLPVGTSTPASQIGTKPSSTMIEAIVNCPNCGSRFSLGQSKCPACGASI